jgi:hypothetical protein
LMLRKCIPLPPVGLRNNPPLQHKHSHIAINRET